MKYLLQLTALMLALLSLSSCGDFYTFEETEAHPVSITVAQDTAYLMVGDTLPLRVSYAYGNATDNPVFWMPLTGDTIMCGVITNDSLTAISVGEMDAVAVCGSVSGHTDTCHVIVLEPWAADSIAGAYHDMIYYAHVTVGGREFDPASMIVAAFNGDEIIGVGEIKEWRGIRYVQLRMFLNTEAVDESARVSVTVRCYDKSTCNVYQSHDDLYFDGETHGTLSNLLELRLE